MPLPNWLSLILLLPSVFAADDWQKYDQPGQKDRNSLMTPQSQWQKDLAQCRGAAFTIRQTARMNDPKSPDTYDEDMKSCLVKRGYELKKLE